MHEFVPFPKIPRLNRPVIITEKIDGTNAAIFVPEDFDHEPLVAQSRKKVITPGKQTDNFGFARWVADNAHTLGDDLGPGLHFGEWYGQGIQRGYGMSHKAFALFNTSRWSNAGFQTEHLTVIPTLCEAWSLQDYMAIEDALVLLESHGSYARFGEGWPNPEGIIIYQPHSNLLFKVTLENDEQPKSKT